MLNEIFFNEITEVIRQLKEAIDKLVKEINVIDTDEFKDTKQK